MSTINKKGMHNCLNGTVRVTGFERAGRAGYAQSMSGNPFRYFNTSPEIIRLALMLYVRFPLSLRNVEDLLHERGIDVCYESVRYWWNRFGPIFASEIRKKRSQAMRESTQWRWYLDEVFVKINGKQHYL